jgi:hypothetical protein
MPLFLEHMKQTPLNNMGAISPSSFASFFIPPPIARHCISIAAEIVEELEVVSMPQLLRCEHFSEYYSNIEVVAI